MLILAATPIGNLSDASQRLIEALSSHRFIAAEDTRVLLKLANALGVHLEAKLFSLHEHNETARIEQLLAIALEHDLLVVSDAGMPTVSDPGFELVRAAVAQGIEVSVIPGPSAVLAALAVSGLPTDRFSFEGFLPRKSAERRRCFEALATDQRTMVFFESPHRIEAALADAIAVLGSERQASVSRELTKKFEQTVRGTLAELQQWATQEPRGEIVLVIAGAAASETEETDLDALASQALQLADSGAGVKQAVAEIASANRVGKSELYSAVLRLRSER